MNTNPNDNNQQSTESTTSQQYQNVFDKYSEELKNTKPALDEPEVAEAITPPVEPPVVVPEKIELKPVEPQPELPQTDLNAKLDTSQPVATISEPKIDTPQANISANIEVDEPLDSPLPPKPEPVVSPPQAPIIENKTTGSVPPTENEPPILDTVPKSGSNLFKILFIFSLIVFLGVLGVIAYTLVVKDMFFPKEETVQTSNASDTNSQTVVDQEYVCYLNDKKYKIGESFEAADGCNVCSCNSDTTIVCTEKICDVSENISTPSSTIIPTKTASQSASEELDD